VCPVMSKEMLRVHEAFKDAPDVAIISHSIDPGYDSVDVLRDYAERLGVADNQQWHFVTGRRDDIFRMSRQGYMVPVEENPALIDGLDHSGKFILVDKQRHIRGYYNGTEPAAVDKLIKDIRTLRAETERAS
ncbi:MAG: SCO family protein, partial [Catalinimonas sp.]